MNKWSAYAQINCEERSEFYDFEFDVSDEVYEQIRAAIKEGTPLYKCPFYDGLESAALEELGKLANEDLREYLCGEEPDREGYDSDEEYEEALEEYNEYSVLDDYGYEDLSIYDPYYEKSFANQFIGRTFPEWATGEAYSEDFEFEENDWIIATYHATVCFDGNGTVTDITNVYGEAMECDDVKSSDWGDCEPNYILIEEKLEKILNGEEVDDE